MSLPDRNNPYNFNPLLEWRKSVDFYADDPFLQKMVRFFAGREAAEHQARERYLKRLSTLRSVVQRERRSRPS